MKLLVELSLRSLGTKKESYAGNVAIPIIIGYKQSKNINAKSVKQGPLCGVGQ
jgi:hypothetical protein